MITQHVYKNTKNFVIKWYYKTKILFNMKTISLKLGFAIIKRNILYFIAMFLLVVLTSLFVFVSSATPDSLRSSIYNFIYDYNMAEANITTKLFDKDSVNVSSVDNIDRIEYQLVFESSILVSQDLQKFVRVFSIENNDFVVKESLQDTDMKNKI